MEGKTQSIIMTDREIVIEALPMKINNEFKSYVLIEYDDEVFDSVLEKAQYLELQDWLELIHSVTA